jgi:outer membrane lipoprotein-sorting protein
VLTPKKSGLKRTVQQLTVYLDSDLNVRRADLILPKGDHTVTTYSAQRRGALPASTFEFAAPADARVTHPLGK